MTDVQKQKKLRKHLEALTRPQLVALATQRTDLTYQQILTLPSDMLASTLSLIPGCLKPVNASGGVAVADEDEEGGEA
jgi:hypothetical protein